MTKNEIWYDKLEKRGIHMTEEQRHKISKKINDMLSYEPTIGIFGKTGVGKSSLCNALFGQDICQISDVASCTRNPQEVVLNMGGKGMRLLDVPGVGESEDRDEEYAELYNKLLPELDLVLWVVKADDRAMTSDEIFYKNIVKSHVEQGKPFLMIVNQVDKIEPFRQWDEENHEPGPVQFQNMHKKMDVLADMFELPKSKVVAVSANEHYNLTALVDEMVFALPNDKKVTVLTKVSNEYQSDAAKENAEQGFWSSLVDSVVDTVTTIADDVVTLAEDIWDGISDFFSFW